MKWSIVKNFLTLSVFGLLTIFILTSLSPQGDESNPQNITEVEGEQIYEDVDSNYTNKVENDEIDPSESLIGGPDETLRINGTGFNFRVMELTAGDSLTVANDDNRTHNLAVRDLEISREVNAGSEINIEIPQGGVYTLESNLFDEERVSIDVNAR